MNPLHNNDKTFEGILLKENVVNTTNGLWDINVSFSPSSDLFKDSNDDIIINMHSGEEDANDYNPVTNLINIGVDTKYEGIPKFFNRMQNG